ncbi:uncharacterized protein LOC108682829 [Hyalella azteca]|uniref:Uncharacterized protein LOC108682829 n=1 Tax=Hyalella azteca TaxID=294128 RepID=A0A8B7PMY5_HYAAZ|nr:uncharacterized protein LOC108682829 [Hyalella azteca]
MADIASFPSFQASASNPPQYQHAQFVPQESQDHKPLQDNQGSQGASRTDTSKGNTIAFIPPLPSNFKFDYTALDENNYCHDLGFRDDAAFQISTPTLLSCAGKPENNIGNQKVNHSVLNNGSFHGNFNFSFSYPESSSKFRFLPGDDDVYDGQIFVRDTEFTEFYIHHNAPENTRVRFILHHSDASKFFDPVLPCKKHLRSEQPDHVMYVPPALNPIYETREGHATVVVVPRNYRGAAPAQQHGLAEYRGDVQIKFLCKNSCHKGAKWSIVGELLGRENEVIGRQKYHLKVSALPTRDSKLKQGGSKKNSEPTKLENNIEIKPEVKSLPLTSEVEGNASLSLNRSISKVDAEALIPSIQTAQANAAKMDFEASCNEFAEVKKSAHSSKIKECSTEIQPNLDFDDLIGFTSNNFSPHNINATQTFLDQFPGIDNYEHKSISEHHQVLDILGQQQNLDVQQKVDLWSQAEQLMPDLEHSNKRLLKPDRVDGAAGVQKRQRTDQEAVSASEWGSQQVDLSVDLSCQNVDTSNLNMASMQLGPTFPTNLSMSYCQRQRKGRTFDHVIRASVEKFDKQRRSTAGLE